MPEIVLVKLGGSLLTDKSRPDAAHEEVITRLAEELAAVSRARPGELVVGHGSGSFGHVAAERHEIHRGLSAPDQLPGVSRTQERAAALHRRVSAALLDAGAVPWSFQPSSALVAEGGRPRGSAAPLVRALELGLLPVTWGDVVLDRERGAAILSTEAVFTWLVDALAEAGLAVRRALWLGATDGVLGEDGERIERVTVDEAGEALAAAGGSGGTDVTGGMRLRLETAVELARRGVVSQILDGREPGIVARALAGEPVGGTRVG